MAEITLIEAVNQALAWEMASDENVLVLGEDVGVNGGVCRATLGLQERFGEERVLDTPLAENLIGGVAIGMAAQGLRPVAEIQFMGFIYPTIDQIVSHATRMRNRTRGRISCPIVLRAPLVAEFTRQNTIRRAQRLCLLTFPVCAWSFPPLLRVLMVCCWQLSATPTRWFSLNPNAFIA